MAAMLFRNSRSQRRGRLKGRQESGEEYVTLDYTKNPADNLREVLCNIVKKDGISKEKKLGYYNAFVRLCHRFGTKFDSTLSDDEILCCLRVGLAHEAKEMRTACLRAIRHYLQDKNALDALTLLRIDYLIARSLDICLDPADIERIHALRLIRHIMILCPEKFPTSLIKVMVSIANDGVQERDKMVRTCLATICELAFYNPLLVCEHGGTSAILKNVLNCHQLARINESLLATVLYLLNHPRSRHHIRADVDIEQVLAPFTDCHSKLPTESSDFTSEEDGKYAASKMAIVTIMKSWPGLVRMCRPDGSGLQSLFGVLYLPNMETRKEIMDILFDMFRIAQPHWTEDFSEALQSIDPSEMHESWRLMEGFVAEEGKALLPHIAKTRPDLVENHMALVLAAFISAGLLEALVEVIITSDDFVSVRATILLGELLYMANTIVPSEASQISHCLPTLISMATSYSPSPERNLAKRAVTCLDRHHAMKKRGPVPCTLFLDQIVQRGALLNENYKQLVKQEKLQAFLDKESDAHVVGNAIRDSQILATKENVSWDWHLINTILQWPDETLRKLDDQNVVRFVKRLLYFYKPTNRLYSAVETSREDSQLLTKVALQFIDFLLSCDPNEAQKYIEELLGDIAQCLAEIRAQRAPQDALFTPSFLVHTLSQDYFLLLGRFSQSAKGEKYLETSGIYQFLLDLMTITSHDTYIKLVVSSIDSSREGNARLLLSKGLTASSESARLYTANFMRVLLRARVPFFSSWGIEMLVMQLYDQSKAVAMEALSVISEACEDEVSLLSLVKLRPSVLHLGHKGAMLLARFLSIPAGFKFLTDANYIEHELQKWHKSFNQRYVEIVEERLNEALTTYERTYDGQYTRRSSRRVARKDVFVPIHLYGQLVQHKAGYQLVESQEYIKEYFDCVRNQTLHSEEQILTLKKALWVVGHIGSSVWGISMLIEENIVPEIIKLAEECGVFSIRGTSFYVLGLIASTSKGAGILNEYGWDTVRHKRSDLWPVIEDLDTEDCICDNVSEASSITSFSSQNKRDSATPAQLRALFEPLDPVSARKISNYSRVAPSPKFFLGGEALAPGSKSRSSTLDSGEALDAKTRSETSGSSPARSTSPLRSTSDSNENVTSLPSSANGTLERNAKLEMTRQPSTDQATSESEGFQTPPSRYESATASNYSSLESKHSRSQSDPVPNTRVGSSSIVVHFETDEESQNFSSALHPAIFEDAQLNTNSNSDLVSPEQPEVSKGVSNSETMLNAKTNLRVGHLGSFRDERSGSNESSHTSKSRSDSVNTDITTSGISSYESGPQTGSNDHQQLSPIPSASSINNDSTKTFQFPDVDKQSIHPSDSLRRLANLRRIPSVQRRYSNPSLGHLSPRKVSHDRSQRSESMILYTSSKDLSGYAKLKEIQQRRPTSTEDDNPVSPRPFDEPSSLPTTMSLDFRLGKPSGTTRGRNLSFQSLQEFETSPSPYDTLPRSTSKEKLKKSIRPSGKAEYIGLALPVDISMIFQVQEGEDPRCAVPEVETKEDNLRAAAAAANAVEKSGGPLRSVSQVDAGEALENHTLDNCLGCFRLKRDDSVFAEGAEVDDEALLSVRQFARHLSVDAPKSETSRGASPVTVPGGVRAGLRSNSSFSDLQAALPGSVSSNISVDSNMPKSVMSEDSEVGRNLIRKEVMRLIINLSSSVGVKGTEKGLLGLKQKFPKTYQDICLYSEVCHTLANYNYRLASRRFIQELFQDVNFEQMLEEPAILLNISAESEEAGPSEADVKLDKVLEAMA